MNYIDAGRSHTFEHTWVTSYDSRNMQHADIGSVIASGHDFWFCWGLFHSVGGTSMVADGLIGQRGADLALARCLVTENLPCSTTMGARGTVFRYLKDGCCHQLANQVLYSTLISGNRALTVKGVGGYMASTWRFGTYGRNEAQFRSKAQACRSASTQPTTTVSSAMNTSHFPELVDEFSERVQEVLGAERPWLAERLLGLRKELQETDSSAPEHENVDAINERGNTFLAAARDLLGDQLFYRIFEIEPGRDFHFPSYEQE